MNSFIRFRLCQESFNKGDWFSLLDRLNCQKAAMRSLRLARNHSKLKHERLVYEGWILYDTGHREEALAKAEESISIQRSFEVFFLKAYALADSTLDPKSSEYVIQLLEEALRCPSDALRKGQVSIKKNCCVLEGGRRLFLFGAFLILAGFEQPGERICGL